MEVVTATHSGPGSAGSPGGPFQRHNVEEWQRLDRLTGVLETARRESGSWRNDQQQYGKVVDSCSLVSADGSAAQRQLRQLEVFQSRSPGASLQVIRAHTHTSTSSSSRWSHTAGAIAGTAAPGQEFENLQLALNPLDLSSQKTKASVGRSGSISGRRPPSRPRSLTSDLEVTARLQKVSRLCQQLHEEAVHTATNENLTKRSSIEDEDLSLRSPFDRSFKPFEERPSILERQNGDGSVSSEHFDSSEPLSNGRIEDWRQSRLNTALRGNNVDLEALDQILKSISSSTTSSSYSDKISLSDDLLKDEPEKDSSKNLKKRHSFITAESLQEVRGRLRRLSSPVDEYHHQTIQPSKEEEPDDGIVAEDTSMMKKEDTMPASNNGVSRVRSYVYGMEAMLHNKKPIIGTGSLESRSSNKSNGNSVNRSEDWYNRRKSYGFEQVHNQQIDHSNSISLRGKNKIESSTDSGICRSTEIVVIPSVFKSQTEDSNKYNKVYSKVGNSTVINLGGETTKTPSNITEYANSNNSSKDNELFNVWNRRAIVTLEDSSNKKDLEQITITIPIVSEESTVQNGRRMYHRQISEGTSVSVESNWSNGKQNSPEIKRHSIAVDETKYDNKYSYPQLRRTSLALESSKPEERYDFQDEDNGNNFGKKHKKVEFCKTEVHFAAESGRVNIVETDEKPPPTQNFRRRRRNSNVTNNHVPEDFNKNGLPLIHFGDTSYEKKLFGVSDEVPQNGVAETYNKEVKPYNGQPEAILCNNVTVSAVSVTSNAVSKDFEQDNIEYDNPPRGILKNRMIKPRPYLLGDDNNELLSQNSSNNEDPDSTIWGVRLRPVHKEETPQIWRSTVTVQNTSYNTSSTENASSTYEETPKPEFQKLLHSLRPARKSEPSITSPENTMERSSPILDLRRSSWSVADRVKQVEDMKQTEIKGYSTRVNFGGGEATVVENGDLMKKEERHPTWPRQEETHNKDDNRKSSSVLQKGLVVRIGREDSNHTVCSKTTTNHNSQSTTTTTKITIDMSPSPTTNLDKLDKFPVPIKLPRASLHSLKSTSLIMNTFAKESPKILPTNRSQPEAIPDQLAALKKLYDEAAEHSDDSQLADEEVRSYMSANGEDSDVRDTEDEVSSVVSGSWSKMKAFRNIKQHLNSLNGDPNRLKETEMFRNIINRSTYTKRDFPSSNGSLQPPQKKPDPLITSRYDKNISSEAKVTSVSVRCTERRSSNNSSLDSPQLERKPISNIKRYDIARTTNSNGHLSSPSLVGSSVQKSNNNTQKSVINSRADENKFTSERSAFNKVSTSSKESPSIRRKNITKKSLVSNNNQTYTKSVVKNNYYNEISSPNPTKKLTDKPRYHGNHNKPDLLQFSDNREYVNLTTVIREENKTSKPKDIKKEIPKRPESPIYENIDEVINNLQQMEKESTMLQELTKAADQILQAVNGYTDEDSNKVSEEDSEDESRKHRLNFKKTSENLSTISETKSWKQKTQTKVSSNVKNTKSRVKPTSSTSSIESITKESKPVPPVRMNRATKLNEAKKKITGSNSELSKATKARRLQRASSREALLQSHGSSSEDIASNIDINRKPRLVRRSKTQTQNTVSEEISKKSVTHSSVSRRTQSDVRKSVERVPVIGLQEIRHKTAISTIKSTAEKNASREKALKAKEELKKKTAAKSTSISRGLTSSSSYSRPSSRDAGVTARSSSLTMKKFNKTETATKY